MFAGNFAPRSNALCDGQLLNISQNDALFSLFGTRYGGDGRTTFGLPDLRGRIPIHAGSGPGLTPRSLGAKGGRETVTLTAIQLPHHAHDLVATTDLGNESGPAGNLPAQSTVAQMYLATNPTVVMSANSVQNKGGSESHTNLQPFLCVNFIVALTGIYPSRS